MTKQELLILKLRKALRSYNMQKMKFLLQFANTPWLRLQPEVLQAESYLMAHMADERTRCGGSEDAPEDPPPLVSDLMSVMSEMDAQSSGAHTPRMQPPLSPNQQGATTRENTFHQKLTNFLRQLYKERGLYPYASLSCLRTKAQYLKKIFFFKSYHKHHRLIHQSKPIPHSVTRLADSSHDVKQRAKLMFRNVLFFCGEQYHPYPLTLGHEVLNEAVQEPQLRPEIICQLLKQLNKPKKSESVLRCWKLIYMCFYAFEPPTEVKKCLLSTAALHVDHKIDLTDIKCRNRLGTMSTVQSIATLILLLEFRRAGGTHMPTMNEVEAISDADILPESMEPIVFQMFKKKGSDARPPQPGGPPPKYGYQI